MSIRFTYCRTNDTQAVKIHSAIVVLPRPRIEFWIKYPHLINWDELILNILLKTKSDYTCSFGDGVSVRVNYDKIIIYIGNSFGKLFVEVSGADFLVVIEAIVKNIV